MVRPHLPLTWELCLKSAKGGSWRLPQEWLLFGFHCVLLAFMLVCTLHLIKDPAGWLNAEIRIWNGFGFGVSFLLGCSVVLITKNQACFFPPAYFPNLSTSHSGKCLLWLPGEEDNSPTIDIDLSLGSILLVKSCFYSDNPELISNLKRVHCWIPTEGIIFNHSVYWIYKSSYWSCLYTVIFP